MNAKYFKSTLSDSTQQLASFPAVLSISALRRACETDKLLFAKTYTPNNLRSSFTEHHQQILDLCDIQNQIVVISAFRGKGKSTLASFIDPLHKIAYNQVNIILFIGYNLGIALQFSSAIRRFLEETPQNSAQFVKDFPDVAGMTRGVQDDFTTHNGVRIVSLGVLKSPRSKLDLLKGERPDMVIFDDYESDKSAYSEIESKKIQNYMMQGVYPAMRPPAMGGFYFRTVNTTLSPISVQTSMLNSAQERGFLSCRVPVVDIDGQSTWPEVFSQERIRQIQQEAGTYAWHSEYLLQPLSGDVQIFREEWPRYTDTDWTEQECVQTVGAIDVAFTSKSTSDFKAIIILSVKYHPTVQVLCRYAWIRRSSVQEFLGKIQDLQEKYKCRFTIEENALHDFLWDAVSNYESQHGCILNLHGITHTTKKEARISRIESPFERRMLWFLRGHSDQQALLNQFFAFPNGTHDDGIDAYAEAFNQLMQPTELLPVSGEDSVVRGLF